MADDFLDRIEDDEEELYRSYVKPVHPLAVKIFIWLALVGGVAVGVLLFLFFLTLFIYVFLPLAVIAMIWLGFKKWRFGCAWRKMQKNFYRD